MPLKALYNTAPTFTDSCTHLRGHTSRSGRTPRHSGNRTSNLLLKSRPALPPGLIRPKNTTLRVLLCLLKFIEVDLRPDVKAQAFLGEGFVGNIPGRRGNPASVLRPVPPAGTRPSGHAPCWDTPPAGTRPIRARPHPGTPLRDTPPAGTRPSGTRPPGLCKSLLEVPLTVF